MKTYSLHIKVNGKPYHVEVSASETLLEVLRNKLDAKEVKNGCGKGDCGACTVLLNGEAVNACLTLALQVDDKEIVTLKGIGTEIHPHALQECFVEHGAIQCGFCTAGHVLSAKALLDKVAAPDRKQIRTAISGNICRCTGYNKIVEAIESAAHYTART